MSSISFLSYVTDPGDVSHSRITDLEVITVDGLTQLYSSTRYDGVLRRWDVNGGSLEQADSFAFDGAVFAGGVGGIVPLTFGADSGLLVGGGLDGALQTVALGPNGGFGMSTTLTALPDTFQGFQYGTALTLDDGTLAVFGAIASTSGLGRLRFSSDGALQDHAILQSGPPGNTAQIMGTAFAISDGQYFVVTVSGQTNMITASAISQTGDITGHTMIGPEQGLWISAPTALETTTVGGTTFAILGAAGSNSLTVVEIGSDGEMIVRDHILDARETRFGGVTSLEVIEADGKTYVIAGGADDGVSVFLLLEGGLLVHRAVIEDTDDFGLDNVSALAGRHRTAGIDIFVASSSEPGVTQLLFETGPAGVTQTAALTGGLLDGTNGNDILQGHDGNDLVNAGQGDDILRDGTGNDVMTGGAGADLFILTADSMTDTITDFTLGEDTIDLSLWPMLRDISQLFITIAEDGMRITYGQEVLHVQSANGEPIDYRLLGTTDLIGASRLPFNLTPGYPGPATPTPILGEQPALPPADQGGPNNALTPLQLLKTGNLGELRDAFDATHASDNGVVIDGNASAETLIGSDQFDLILAGAGSDTVNGLGGDDTLFGRQGNDTLLGGDGADTILGGLDADTLAGGNGQDLLDGGAGDDILDGGAGDDFLFGDTGADTFMFNYGTDVISDFEQGVDQIVLDPVLWTGLTSSADVLFVYGNIADGRATIDFGDGNILIIDGITNPTGLADDISLF